MKVVDSFEDLLDRLGSIFLCKLAVFADPVKKLSPRRQLGDYVILVLYNIKKSVQSCLERSITTKYLRLEPIVESNDVGMFHSLQQDHLIVHHLLVAFDVLLKNDLDGISLSAAFCFPNDAVCPCTQRPAESILGSETCVSTLCK